jgi:hypothetical protein
MPRPKQFLLHRKRSPVERLGVGPLAFGLIKGRQIVQVDGDLIVLRAVRALENRQRPTVEWL